MPDDLLTSHLARAARGILGTTAALPVLIELRRRYRVRQEQQAATIRRGQAKKLVAAALKRTIWLHRQLPDLVVRGAKVRANFRIEDGSAVPNPCKCWVWLSPRG